jgi:hypothetical protein
MEARVARAVPAIMRMERKAAEQGTKGHAVAAATLGLIYYARPWQEPAAALAKMQAGLAELEPWAADATRRCISYVVALVDREVAAGYRVGVLVEMHLSGKGVDIPRGGTADVVIVCRGADGCVVRVIVVDHKLGWLDQGHAADHPQLGTYAVMAWDRWSTTAEVEVHLAQGRRMDFTSALYRDEEIEFMRSRARAIVAGALDDSAELTPAIDACRYCKSITHCRALRERIMNARDELALFGDAATDRVKLAEDAALARRFAEEARELAKVWQAESLKAAGVTL